MNLPSEWVTELLSYSQVRLLVIRTFCSRFSIINLKPLISTNFKIGYNDCTISLRFSAEPFKLALRVELKAWKLLFGHSINNKYKHSMDEITQFVSDYSKRLARQINDLEDVRNAMAALEDIRQNEIRIDMILGPIEVLHLLKFTMN